MSRIGHRDIRIGTLSPMPKGADYIRQILPHGFESFELNAWMHVGDLDLAEYAKEALDACGTEAVISSIGVYGNPLQDAETEADWARLIRAARSFGCDVVCGFAGAQEDRPVDENMGRFKEVWGPLAKLAEDEGVRIAFENCDMGGTWHRPAWNIAHAPRAWEMSSTPWTASRSGWNGSPAINSSPSSIPSRTSASGSAGSTTSTARTPR